MSAVQSAALLMCATLAWEPILFSSFVVEELFSCDELSGALYLNLSLNRRYIFREDSSVSRLSRMYIQGSMIELVTANLSTRSSVGPLVFIERVACCRIFI